MIREREKAKGTGGIRKHEGVKRREVVAAFFLRRARPLFFTHVNRISHSSFFSTSLSFSFSFSFSVFFLFFQEAGSADARETIVCANYDRGSSLPNVRASALYIISGRTRLPHSVPFDNDGPTSVIVRLQPTDRSIDARCHDRETRTTTSKRIGRLLFAPRAVSSA